MELEQHIVGFTSEGEVIIRYTMTNSSGMRVTLLNCGAAIESITSPLERELTITYPSYKEYLSDSLSMGKCVGRYAGRIAKGALTIDEINYKLSSNEGTTHLNGGVSSFSSKLWQARSEGDMVVFSYISPNGEEGYPGELGVEIGYTLTDNNELSVTIMGESDNSTIVNIAPFVYFSFGSEARLSINATKQVVLGRKSIPTGELSELDLREPQVINQEIDDYWLIEDNSPNIIKHHATLESGDGEVKLEVRSTQPMLYVSSCDDIEGCGFNSKGEELSSREATLLAPMNIAYNSINRVLLRGGERYHHQTIYAFKF